MHTYFLRSVATLQLFNSFFTRFFVPFFFISNKIPRLFIFVFNSSCCFFSCLHILVPTLIVSMDTEKIILWNGYASERLCWMCFRTHTNSFANERWNQSRESCSWLSLLGIEIVAMCLCKVSHKLALNSKIGFAILLDSIWNLFRVEQKSLTPLFLLEILFFALKIPANIIYHTSNKHLNGVGLFCEFILSTFELLSTLLLRNRFFWSWCAVKNFKLIFKMNYKIRIKSDLEFSPHIFLEKSRKIERVSFESKFLVELANRRENCWCSISRNQLHEWRLKYYRKLQSNIFLYSKNVCSWNFGMKCF